MNAVVYNQQGEKVEELFLDESVFGLKWNADLVHQVVLGMQANKRIPWAHAKGRGEVRGGGKKPWRQKGLGRARHGSIRSPIWRGGGVTHGPLKEKNYKKKINKKMSKKAFFTGLSQKLRDKEILFLDKLELQSVKTKIADSLLKNLRSVEDFKKLGAKGGKALLLSDNEKNIKLSFRNLPYIEAKEARNANILDLLQNKYIVLTKEGINNFQPKADSPLAKKIKSIRQTGGNKKFQPKAETKN